MNIIFNGRVHECTKMEIIEGHLFLDDKEVGKCEEPKFRASTIKGEVYMAQWKIINGGANV